MLRRNGACVGTSVVVATAKGVIMNKNADLLVSNGGYQWRSYARAN